MAVAGAAVPVDSRLYYRTLPGRRPVANRRLHPPWAAGACGGAGRLGCAYGLPGRQFTASRTLTNTPLGPLTACLKEARMRGWIDRVFGWMLNPSYGNYPA